MYFESFADFLEMGRHGFYVWTAYGVTLALIVANLVAMIHRRRQVRADIGRALRRERTAENSSPNEQSS
jgi:heme exporter protein D